MFETIYLVRTKKQYIFFVKSKRGENMNGVSAYITFFIILGAFFEVISRDIFSLGPPFFGLSLICIVWMLNSMFKKQNKEVDALKKEIEKLKAEPDSESTDEADK